MTSLERAGERHPGLLSRASTAIFVVDIQERFRDYVAGFDGVVSNTRLLLRAAELMDIPVVFSEQYPKGLGATVDELMPELDGAAYFEKLEISSACARGYQEATADLGDDVTWLVTGIEAHVCVNQTVHDMLHQGHRVHVCADAVGSHDPYQRDVALRRFAAAGATVTTVEAAIFELLQRAGTDEFKQVQQLIKLHDRPAVGVAE